MANKKIKVCLTLHGFCVAMPHTASLIYRAKDDRPSRVAIKAHLSDDGSREGGVDLATLLGIPAGCTEGVM
jgi:hypothetical protein